MSPRERAVAVLEGRIPDRVPCVPLIDTSYAAAVAGISVSECFLNPEAYALALVATLERHPDIDGVSINIGLSDDVVEDHTHAKGVHPLRTRGGLTWMVPENHIGSIEHCVITDLADLRIDTEDYLMAACLWTLRAIPVDQLTREALRLGKQCGRFMLSSGCCLGRDTPPCNVDAMVHACEDHGAY